MDSCHAHRMQRRILVSMVLFVKRSVLFAEEGIKYFSDHALPCRFLTPYRRKYRSSGTVLLLAPLHVEKVFRLCFFGPGWRRWGQSAEAASAEPLATCQHAMGPGRCGALPSSHSPHGELLPLAFGQLFCTPGSEGGLCHLNSSFVSHAACSLCSPC